MATPRAQAMQRLREEEELRKMGLSMPLSGEVSSSEYIEQPPAGLLNTSNWERANNWFNENIFDFNSLPKNFPFNTSDAMNVFNSGTTQGETASKYSKPQNYPLMNALEGASTYMKNLDSPFKGVCVLPNGMVTQQMSRIECDAAGGTYSDPSTVKAEQIKAGQDNDSILNFDAGIPGMAKLIGGQVQQMREATDAGAFDNRMQNLGLEMTPEVIDYYTKYRRLPLEGGKNYLISEQGDIPTTEDVVGNAAPYGLQTDGLLTSEQMMNRYPDRYAENAIANKSIFDDAMRQAEARDVLGRSSDQVYNNMEDELFLQQRAINDAEREQQVRGILDERMSADASAAPAYGAEQAILQEEARIEAERQQRLANIQSNIAQQDEMESGYVKYQITGNNEIDNVISNAIEATIETGTTLGEDVSEITAGAIETLGPLVEQGMEQAKILGNQAITYMQDEAIPEISNLFQGASDAAIATTQSLLADDPADGSSSEDMTIDEGKTTDGKTTDVKTNTVTTSTDSSQGSNGEISTPKQAEAVVKKTFSSEGGFNMDRLTNPLSPENRAWWFGQRPGDIPGNNRAVEFFNALAYIGTPLKYRPAKTPMETLQERRIQHSNNLMDAAASRQTALQAGSNAAYTRLKGMVIKPETLQNSYLTDTKSDSWFKRTFGDGLTGEEKQAQSYQTAIQINQIMTELAMAGVPPSKDVAEGLYSIRVASGRPVISATGQVSAEEKRLASLPKSELRDIIKKAESDKASGTAVSGYFSLKQ
jgi:hypothetical protein